MLNAITNHCIAQLICRWLIVGAIAISAGVYFRCNRADEMREIRGVVLGHYDQIEEVNK
jgi:hypothetical protein